MRRFVPFLLMVLWLGLDDPARATFPGQNGKIAGVRSTCGPPGECSWDVYTINEDGAGLAQLTGLPKNEDQPAWSADGSKIAVRSWCENSLCATTVAVMNADGSGLTQFGPGSYPSWSPDATKIAFTGRTPEGAAGIYTMRADGSDVSFLGDGLQPAWSPDGTKIAFTGPGEDPNGQLGAGQDIYVMNANGSSPVRLTFNGDQAPPECGGGQTLDEADSRPDWSPDGTRIVYVQFTNDLCLDGEFAWAVETVDAAGGPERVVANSNFCGIDRAVWSPDGEKILFGGCGLETVRPDGTGRALSGISMRDPNWQPIVNHPPDCSSVAADPRLMWPPSGRLRTVELSGATDPDGDAATVEITGVTQDERVRGALDAFGAAENAVRLRAKRDPRGDGRVYRIAFTATDSKGAQCEGTASVSVPRHKRQAAVDSAPPSYNSLGR